MVSDINIREQRFFAALLGFSLVIKGILIFQTDIINPDGIRYINSAYELFQGNIPAAFGHEKQLGYTALLGLFHLIIPDWLMAGQVLSSLSLLLATIPLYLLTRELFGPVAALCAGLAFSVAPYTNELSVEVVKDPVFALLIVAALWAAVQGVKRKNWSFLLLASLLSCLSITVRIDGLVFFLAVAVFLFFSMIFNGEQRRQHLVHFAAYSALPLAGFLVLLTTVFSGGLALENLSVIYAKFRHYFETDLFKTYQGIYQRLKEIEPEFAGGLWTNDFFEFARHNMLLIYLVGMLQVFAKSIFPVFLIPLCFGLRLRKHLCLSLLLLLAVMLSYFAMDFFFLLSRNFLAGRYMLVPVVLSFPLIGAGFDVLLSRVSSLRFSKISYSLVIVLCVILPAGKSFSNVLDEKIEIKEAGGWLAAQRDLSAERLIVNSERVAFYAGLMRGEYAIFPARAADRYEKKALKEECDLMVLLLDAKRRDDVPAFEKFALIKSFYGRKKIVKIYERAE